METIAISVISALSVIGVAAVGAVVQLRIASTQTRREQAADRTQRDREARDERYARTQAFLESLGRPMPHAMGSSVESQRAEDARWRLQAQLSRTRLLAVLEANEAGFARYTRLAISHTGFGLDLEQREEAVGVIGETLFAYLRGEISDAELRQISDVSWQIASRPL